MSHPPKPIVTARDLVLSYGDLLAIDTSTFDVPGGAVTAVIGPNGSGKSTILNAIAGLAKPAGGEIVLRGRGGRPGIAYVFQATKVNESMPVTVQEVVSMGRYGRLGPFRPFRETDRAVCRVAMGRLDILDLATRHLDELSGGQRQRVFVAQGLAQEAELLLLDERIDELQRRDPMLGFDDPPGRAREPPFLRRERGGRPGSRRHSPGREVSARDLPVRRRGRHSRL